MSDLKETKPTLQRVKKEWKDIRYEWFENGGIIVLEQQINHTNIYITINSVKKEYWKTIGSSLNFIPFSLREHKLLTKTFKALGWEV